MSNEEKIPEGKIKTVDGQIIDRTRALFMLRKHPKSDKIFMDSRGIQYVKDEKGTLRRFPQKEKKR
jgi:hypothetical protein